MDVARILLKAGAPVDCSSVVSNHLDGRFINFSTKSNPGTSAGDMLLSGGCVALVDSKINRMETINEYNIQICLFGTSALRGQAILQHNMY